MTAADDNARGFVFTFTPLVSTSGERSTVHNEHPAYRAPDGVVVWAPHRAGWRDAPVSVAATFRTRADGFANVTPARYPVPARERVR